MAGKKTKPLKKLSISFTLDPANPADMALAELLENLNPRLVSEKAKPAVFRVLRNTINSLSGKSEVAGSVGPSDEDRQNLSDAGQR